MTQQTEALEAALPANITVPAPWSWVAVRQLGPRHRRMLQTHLLALDDADRLLRFGRVASDEQVRAYVEQMDFDRDLVFGIFNRRLRIVAMAHLAFDPESDPDVAAAEFGVSVLARWRGRSLGAKLFDHAVLHARNRGAGALVLHIARANTPMLAIVRRAGAEVQFDGAEATARMDLPADTLATQIEALLGHRAAEIDYRIKRHVFMLDKLREACLPSPPGPG